MYLITFLLGTILGSFGSVLITRLEDDVNRTNIKGILFGFSECPNCKKRLHAQHLIPLRSFLKQKGKCAFCGKKISWQYPILEICSGLIAMFSYYLVFDLGSYIIADQVKRITYLFRIITNRGLILLIVQDIKKQELHMPIWIGTTFWILLRQFIGQQGSYKGAVIGSLLFAAVCAILYFGSKRYIKKKYKSNEEGFGQGDIFLGFSLGTLLPFIAQYNALELTVNTYLQTIVVIMLLAAILGIVYAGILAATKQANKLKIGNKNKTMIPFFPCLIVSFWIILCYGDKIISYLFS